MASRAGAAIARVLLMVLGVLVLGAAWLYARAPKPQSSRVEAALDVVGVSSGGSFAWIVRTEHGAVLIDAGLDGQAEVIVAELQKQGLSPDDVHDILLTHGHPDHWGGAARFEKAKVHVGAADAALVRGEREVKSAVGSLLKRLWKSPPPPTHLVELKGDETLDLDGARFRVIPVPGHTPGSVMYLRNGLLFTGDSLLGRGDAVQPSPAVLSEDSEQNRQSLRALLALPFTAIADGHTGVTADARQKLARLFE